MDLFLKWQALVLSTRDLGAGNRGQLDVWSTGPFCKSIVCSKPFTVRSSRCYPSAHWRDYINNKANIFTAPIAVGEEIYRGFQSNTEFFTAFNSVSSV